jgi:hypothetical protein
MADFLPNPPIVAEEMVPMHKLASPALLLVICILAVAVPATAVHAQSSPQPSKVVPERLFLSFTQEAAIADRQWWEGQLVFSDGDPIDSIVLRGVGAVQVWENVELGGTFGFGDTDTPRPLPDGNGATDFDFWGKYLLSNDDQGGTFAVGGMLTIPTGDDRAGLGLDSFGLEVFGSARFPIGKLKVGGHIGVRFNDDGQILLAELDGQTSALLGGHVILPLGRSFNFVGELYYESERLEGLDDDIRLSGAVNWQVARRSTVRLALAVGTEGAPDAQFLVGYATMF